MPKKDTALAVLLGIVAFTMVASRSLFVEGEATGGTMPALHPTTEMPIEDVLAHSIAREAAEAEMTIKASEPARSATPAPTAKSASTGVPKGYVYWKTVRTKVTAYDPSRLSCGKFADGKTSIGQNAWVMDGVASDPTAIPYGTYVVIPGVGGKIVDDTGRAMRNSWRKHGRYHLDLRVTYPYQARRWGVKYLDVKLYRKAR
jgi:3D (Asp-Asp-Asp) domain-containing protein